MAFRILVALFAGAGVTRIAQVYRRFEVAEHSMEPNLSAGDYLITTRRIDSIDRNDIVVFEHPHQGGFWLVKRVVGRPGDVIEIGSGLVRRNGSVVSRGTPGSGRWIVKPGELFVLGDNRAASTGDSRALGPIPIGLVDGTAVARYWPLRSLGRL